MTIFTGNKKINKHVTHNQRLQSQNCQNEGHGALGKNHCLSEGAASRTPWTNVSKMSQSFRLSKRGSNTGLETNAPAKYAINFCIQINMHIALFIDCWFELLCFSLLLYITSLLYITNLSIDK